MKLGSSILFQPISFVIVLAIAALLVSSALIPFWYVMIKQTEHCVHSDTQNSLSELQSEFEQTAELLSPINSVSTKLAKFLKSSVNVTNITFYDIETKVAPLLFQALATVPYLTEISYIGLDGLLFSYYTEQNQAFALYSNSSSSNDKDAKNFYYIQPVNRDTGKLYGVANTSSPSINAKWYEEALNSTYGYASLGTKWQNSHDLLLLSSSRLNERGFISLAFPVTAFTDFITSSLHGGNLYLATKDGRVLVDQGIPNTHMILADDSVSLRVNKTNGHQMDYVRNVSCKMKDITFRASVFDIQGTKYMVYCSPLDIVGLKSVYVLGFPQSGLLGFVHKNSKVGLTLLTVMIVMIVISIFSIIFIIVRASTREMLLCATLIKQMEATQQAERKSMNKSLAFATASHDVRSSLAGLTGLIELSYQEVAPRSELETNLKQMHTCTKDLLGLLNSILDTSKIEAGKMQLEEEEFDLAQLLEDVVDLYHPVAMKKGVDVVLDPCNGSFIKFAHVKGDRGKLKQILCNLLSNAVKFTDEGHIAVRAWVQQPSFRNSIVASNQSNIMKCLSCLFYKKNEAQDDQQAMDSVNRYPNSMDFVLEVDDTGKGIPKEQQKSVFENYVQVKETALGLGGTGLGLGIVQSLVRLMHGDIGIVDKEIGERGTCFRFNVLLAICEAISNDNTREDTELESDRNHDQPSGLCNLTPGSSCCSASPRLIRTSSPRPEASRVVLLIQNGERRRTTQKFMERLGIKVSIVKQWEHLSCTLKKIKQRWNPLSQSSSGSSSTPHSSSGRAKDVPLSSVDGTDYSTSIFNKTNVGAGSSGFVLIVVDTNAGPFIELCRIIAEFKKGLYNPCKVVWLEKPLTHNINFEGIDQEMFDPNDIIISKPFHGSRLNQVIRLLPEFGGSWHSNSAIKTKRERTYSSGKTLTKSQSRGLPSHLAKVQDYGSSSSEKFSTELLSCKKGSTGNRFSAQQGGIDRNSENLSGKKFLVVEDNLVLRKLASDNVTLLGATAEVCKNGEEAVQLVCNGLVSRNILPYDYILMDCEMPVMNGFEATKEIRKMEKHYGVHIPIIALTAHTSGAEVSRTIQAGMDVHLAKPLTRENLLEAIRYIHSE
ncbi:Histidine kinase [Quillaja saponaria]|uniref:histidine kinase n=1 Tax=Quillaja saponaria TaxID=32244 RepID=A0AAD7Q9X8_QUISA|nr:Histidine kinase [Quillaja saponaria]